MRIEESRQIFERESPAVALVAHVSLQERERRHCAVAVDVLDDSRERNAVGEMRDVGQEPADLDFRVYAFAQPPVTLEEGALADGDDRIAAGTVRYADRQRFNVRARDLRVRARGEESYFAVRSRKLA